MHERPVGEGRVGRVEAERLFRRILLYDPANHRNRWHRDCIRKQRDRDSRGPGQVNLDLALSRAVAFDRPHEKSSLEFRLEFYNALNHP